MAKSLKGLKNQVSESVSDTAEKCLLSNIEKEKGASGDGISSIIELAAIIPEISPATRESHGEGEGREVDETRTMLIVGPETFTSKIMTLLETCNQTGIRVKTIPELKPEDGLYWKNENLVNVLFVVDKSDLNGLKSLNEHLSYLSHNYVLSMDRIDFILAYVTPQKPKAGRASVIPACEIAAFLNKFNRPMVTVNFDDGWEEALHDQMLMFLNRFQIVHHQEHQDENNAEG